MGIEILRGFFPEGPLTTFYGLFLLASVISCLWLMVGRSGNVAGSLAISWIVALSATHFDLLIIQMVGSLFCAFIAFSHRSLVGRVVGALFVPKLLFYSLHAGGVSIFSDVENMWKASEIVAYIQVFVMILGGIIHGGYRLRAVFPRPFGDSGYLAVLRSARFQASRSTSKNL